MKKNYLIITAVIIVAAVLTALFYFLGQDKDDSSQNSETLQSQPEENNRLNPDNLFSEASLDDLEVGQKVMVTGDENSDGSLSAKRIVIGGEETDFSQLAQKERPSSTDDLGGQMAEGEGSFADRGQRPDFENLSQEEMEEMRATMEERMANETKGNIPAGAGQSLSSLVGEIIKKDETSLTLELEEGGSKIVFISESTLVNKAE